MLRAYDTVPAKKTPILKPLSPCLLAPLRGLSAFHGATVAGRCLLASPRTATVAHPAGKAQPLPLAAPIQAQLESDPIQKFFCGFALVRIKTAVFEQHVQMMI